MKSTDRINENGRASSNAVTSGSNPGNVPFSTDDEPKHVLSQSAIDRKISESGKGESGDDIHSDKYKKKPDKKEADRGPDFDKYSEQEDGDTSNNAGVFK